MLYCIFLHYVTSAFFLVMMHSVSVYVSHISRGNSHLVCLASQPYHIVHLQEEQIGDTICEWQILDIFYHVCVGNRNAAHSVLSSKFYQ